MASPGNLMEPGDDDADALFSDVSAAQLPVVEVVEMKEPGTSCSQSGNNLRDSDTLGSRTDEKSGLCSQNTQTRARYDQHNRKKILSKYQRKKKAKSSSDMSATQADSDTDQKWIKTENVELSDVRFQPFVEDGETNFSSDTSAPQSLHSSSGANSGREDTEISALSYDDNLGDGKTASGKQEAGRAAGEGQRLRTTEQWADSDVHSPDGITEDSAELYDDLSDTEALSEEPMKLAVDGQEYVNDGSEINMLTSSHISQLENQLQFHFMDEEVLPGLHTSGQLGLSSHLESGWSNDEEEGGQEGEETVEDDEDMDILSLYEFDTFLEPDDGDERRHSSARQQSPVRGAGKLLVDSDHNFSISVTGQSARTVSRPRLKERSESESSDNDQQVVAHERPGKEERVQDDGEETDKGLMDVDRGTKTKSDSNDTSVSVKAERGASVKDKISTEIDASVKDDISIEMGVSIKETGRTGSKSVSEDSVKRGEKFIFRKPAAPTARKGQAGVRGQVRDRQSDVAARSRVALPLPLPRPKNKYDDTRRQSRGQLLQRPTEGQHFVGGKDKQFRGELEMSLMECIEKKNIIETTEVVGKIHEQKLKIDKGVVLNLLHLLIRQGDIANLMKIFTFVCHQGLFNAEVCNAYIRLGCGENKKYDRQLQNIFQHVRGHSIRPAGDCVIALLRCYSTHKGDPKMFWLMLSYFETFPGFIAPLPLLERAISAVLQHKDGDALEKLNLWVVTSKAEASLQRLELALVGKLVVTLQPEARQCLQKVLETSRESQTTQESMPTEDETELMMPLDFSDHDYQSYCLQIQDCASRRDFCGLAKMFVELTANPGSNGPLLEDYARMLLHQGVVASVGSFLQHLQDTCLYDGDGLQEQDTVALAHLASLLLEHVYLHQPAEVTVALFEVVSHCPLVPTKVLLNCRGVWYKVMDASLKSQQLSCAVEVFKDVRPGKKEEQVQLLIKELMRQLVATGDIPAAFSMLSTAVTNEAIDLAEVGSLSPQLMWHALNVGNILVALDLLDLQQSRPGAAPLPLPLPPALLRALLVACSQAGYNERTLTLFQALKRRGVYNGQPLSSHHVCVFKLSTLLTPVEIGLCIEDRLEEWHHTLASQDALSSGKKGVAIQLVAQHDPDLLALPFLALAPRSIPQAVDVTTLQLAQLSPPLQAVYSRRANQMILSPVQLDVYLTRHTFRGMASRGSRSDGASTTAGPSHISAPHHASGFVRPPAAPPSAVRRAPAFKHNPSAPPSTTRNAPAFTQTPTAPQSTTRLKVPPAFPHPPPPHQAGPSVGRQWSLPAKSQPPAREMKRRLSAAPSEAERERPSSRQPLRLPPPMFETASSSSREFSPEIPPVQGNRASPGNPELVQPTTLRPRPRMFESSVPPAPSFDETLPKKAKLSPPGQPTAGGTKHQLSRGQPKRPYHHQQDTEEPPWKQSLAGGFQRPALLAEPQVSGRGVRQSAQQYSRGSGQPHRSDHDQFDVESSSVRDKVQFQAGATSSRGRGSYSQDTRKYRPQSEAYGNTPQPSRGRGKFLEQVGRGRGEFPEQSDRGQLDRGCSKFPEQVYSSRGKQTQLSSRGAGKFSPPSNREGGKYSPQSNRGAGKYSPRFSRQHEECPVQSVHSHGKSPQRFSRGSGAVASRNSRRFSPPFTTSSGQCGSGQSGPRPPPRGDGLLPTPTDVEMLTLPSHGADVSDDFLDPVDHLRSPALNHVRELPGDRVRVSSRDQLGQVAQKQFSDPFPHSRHGALRKPPGRFEERSKWQPNQHRQQETVASTGDQFWAEEDTMAQEHDDFWPEEEGRTPANEQPWPEEEIASTLNRWPEPAVHRRQTTRVGERTAAQEDLACDYSGPSSVQQPRAKLWRRDDFQHRGRPAHGYTQSLPDQHNRDYQPRRWQGRGNRRDGF